MLFENAWTDGYKAFARVYNPETKTSAKIEIDSNVEFFEPVASGPYKCVIDDGLQYTKKLGTWKHARDQVGTTAPQYRYIRENHWGLDSSSYNTSPRTWYLDIETRAKGAFPDPMKALQEVVLIQIKDSTLNSCIVLGTRALEPLDATDVTYIQCSDEVELFEKFFTVFKRCDPSIIYAWNGNGFDYPYLFNRAQKLGFDTNRFSNYGSVSIRTYKSSGDRDAADLLACGHYWLDMLEVYKCNVLKPRASYALDAIAEVELGDRKVPHNEFLDFDSFYTGERYEAASEPYNDPLREEVRLAYLSGNQDDFITKVHKMFVAYGAQDVNLLNRLDAKLKLTPLLLTKASMMGVLIDDTLSTTKPWGIYISHIAMLNHQVLPKFVEKQADSYKGGFVREPVPGKYQWVMNCDVNSMYPMLAMVGFNISPETYVPMHKLPVDLREIVLKYFNNEDEDARLKLPSEIWHKVKEILLRENYSMAMNGAVFDRSKDGLLPQLITRIYNSRKATKKEMQNVERFIVALDAAKKGSKEADLTYQNWSQEALDGISEDCYNRLKKLNEDLQDQLHTKQLALKILINALYGAQGNRYFIFFNREIAAAITGSGRFFIKKLASYIDDKIKILTDTTENSVLYSDTDSCYYSIEPVVKQWLKKHPDASFDEICDFCLEFEENHIVPVIQECINDFAEQFNAPNKWAMGAKREVLCDKIVMVARKRYAARVIDDEGVRLSRDAAHIKVQGLDLVRSMTPQWCKKHLKEAIPVLFDLDEKNLVTWLDKIKTEFTAQDLSSVSASQGISSMDYSIDAKGLPLNVRSALVYNKFITDNHLEDQFSLIQAGDKPKRIFLREGNPFNSNTISWLDGKFVSYIEAWVDWDTTFEKFFLRPLEIMTSALGYNIDNRNADLEAW